MDHYINNTLLPDAEISATVFQIKPVFFMLNKGECYGYANCKNCQH